MPVFGETGRAVVCDLADDVPLLSVAVGGLAEGGAGGVGDGDG